MTYAQTIDYLFSQLPMYSRIGSAAYKADLINTLRLSEATGHPERLFKTIHIAGTNGKGSSSHMLAAVLQAAGYRTGLYTSPHLKNFRERIRLNGKEIEEDYVVQFVEQHRQLLDELKPSFFEMTVAMAFSYFAAAEVEIAVIETGLGGRLDSTNIISPEVCLITNISYDHVALLGPTLRNIAQEKAGIIKPGVPVVISQTQAEVAEVFETRAQTTYSPLYFADQRYHAKAAHDQPDGVAYDITRAGQPYLGNLLLDLRGEYQQMNLPGVLMTLELLAQKGFQLSEEHLRAGLRQVVSSTGLMGRWQTLSQKPLTICDTAHNLDGLAQVLKQVKNAAPAQVHFVFGTVNDKDVSSILEILPLEYRYYLCAAQIPRALPVTELVEAASAAGLRFESYPSVMAAITAARAAAHPEDLVLIGGSTFVVAEVPNL